MRDPAAGIPARDGAGHPMRFLVLVTALSVPFFVLGAVSPTVRIGALDLPASAAMFVVPGLAAAILAHRAGGRAAVVSLLARVVDRPAGRTRWYVAAALLPAAIGALTWALGWLTGQVGSAPPAAPAVLPLLLAAALVGAACEELGWTGYACDPMVRRFGTVGTGLLLGVFWAVWHLIPLLQVGHGAAWIGGWFAGTVATRVIMVGLRNATGGVSAAILMHAMLNVTVAYLPDYDRPAVPFMSALFTVAAAVGVLRLGACRRARPSRSRVRDEDAARPHGATPD
ncbi:CPBP family intramembrane glutamic endopeptidase [Nonomuraea rhodomycinica]|uniref:CPBP family intramembrane metalloprotease n=1 Tax=Nonomuraea rhodomycinica TaxID=1712872 RepID=A0A7Y6M9Z6_9ACTN|nr:CPBP family intramembrane glutamic endopeptidase [Nonomuraea rhodomycinica]NUW39136.1 CPBP family intramembrane metalloprotease [Nonomuraea rhodomycinica]